MRWPLVTAALLGASSVILGAAFQHMGHGGSDVLHTGLRYHQINSAVLLALGLYALDKPASKALTISAGLLTAGTILFSVSLYALALLEMPILGMITPLGGTLLIAGWVSLAFIRPAQLLRKE